MIKDSQAEPPKNRPDMTEGSVDQSAEPRFLVIGRVNRPHGVKGEVRVEPHTSELGRFKKLKFVHIGDPSTKPTGVKSAREHQNVVLLTFEGIDDRDAAELLRDQWLYIPISEAVPLQEGEYFLYQLQDLQVIDQEGHDLGRLVEVIETGANNVFVVRGQFGDILLPDIPEVIQDIDFEKSLVTVQLLPGLVDPALLGGSQDAAGDTDS